ncbi:hypothetical protein M8C21_028610 [Ambrosia artemisiifolia]|uniref:Disease resistance protein At4g27190-like leucine-rich repeats domain-containing protein n=1 Tax=Ambrosia artemisiifolia TaxID=4212 RepID=A0AAD5GV94_AMBAR|nr:hypothetical protein M8C21_028610 [Ambrosia artemisiifolia]
MFTSGRSTTPKLKYIQTRFCKYNLECGLNFHGTISQTTFPCSSDPTISKGTPCSFHNLIEINIKDTNVGTTIFPSHALVQFQKLQKITINECSEVNEVALEGTNGSGLNASQTSLQIPNLTQVNLEYLDGLKYLWKINQWIVLKFPNLTTIHIGYCHHLEHQLLYFDEDKDGDREGCEIKNVKIICFICARFYKSRVVAALWAT